MIQRLKIAILVLTTSFMTICAPLVLAADTLDCDHPATPKIAIQCGACNVNNGDCSVPAEKTLGDTIKQIINLLSVFAGIIAVIMIIVAGLRFVTSSGNQESIAAARRTILYAVIGLVVIALAQVIVHFVLNNTT
jgi:hypothetical protein